MSLFCMPPSLEYGWNDTQDQTIETILGLVWTHVYPPQSTCVEVEWNEI
jgi:hypothetical protein